jgi:hypothetical protein
MNYLGYYIGYLLGNVSVGIITSWWMSAIVSSLIGGIVWEVFELNILLKRGMK